MVAFIAVITIGTAYYLVPNLRQDMNCVKFIYKKENQYHVRNIVYHEALKWILKNKFVIKYLFIINKIGVICLKPNNCIT